MQQLENYTMEIDGKRYALTEHTPETAMQYATRLYHPTAKKIDYTLIKENNALETYCLTVNVNRGKTKPRNCREKVTVTLHKQTH